MTNRAWLWVLLVGWAATAEAQRFFPDGIILSNEYVRQQGLVDLQNWTGGLVTNANVRGLGVSLGQLSGIDPETGEAITDSANLLPLNARSLRVTGSSRLEGALDMNGGAISNAVIYGNGAGLTNLSYTESDPLWAAASNAVATRIDARLASNAWAAADATTNYLPRTGGVLSGVLDAGGNSITNAAYYGDGGGLTNLAVSTTLPVYNNISTNHSLANADCEVISANSYETLVSLPEAGPTTIGRVYYIKNRGSGMLQVRANNGSSLDGVPNGALAIGRNGSLRIIGTTATDWVSDP
jgi:hypothetical protein